jgi:hypothetical protein
MKFCLEILVLENVGEPHVGKALLAEKDGIVYAIREIQFI